MPRYLLVGDIIVDGRPTCPRWVPTEPVIGNLEIPLCESSIGQRADKVVAWRTDETATRALGALGIIAVGLANNHTTDWGTAGLLRTVTVLRQSGLGVFGAGPDLPSALEPWISNDGNLAVFGLTCTVPPGSHAEPDRAGLLACRVATRYQIDTLRAEELPGVSPTIDGAYKQTTLQPLLAAIGREANQGRAVIVHIHWGAAFTFRITPYQRRMAGDLILSGASLVVGHHSHTLGPVGRFSGGIVCFSLGDWVRSPQLVEQSDRQRPGLATDWRNWSRVGLGLSVAVEGGRVADCRLLPVAIDWEDGLPVPVESTVELESVYALLTWMGRLDLMGDGWSVPIASPIAGQPGLPLSADSSPKGPSFIVSYASAR